ncbi:Nucleolar protein 56 [Blastocladiella emersonii ATCC 22665]|nr:Nucleolar protein 56 [Blastocladiella emersonii ATCC 22665]
MVSHILYETSSGYALFERIESDEISQESAQFQASLLDLAKFGKILKLKSFAPFKSAADALENANDVSEGVVSDSLKAFLELNLPKKKATLGVTEKNLAGAIKAELGVDCVSTELVHELGRAIRYHAAKVLKPLKEGDLDRASLGLGHSYSRAKLKFNVHRSDNMIIQAIGILDQLDKDINTFAMRVREWYSWHFPELVKIVNDNEKYARLVKLIGNKANLSEATVTDMADIIGDQDKAEHVLQAARASMGTDISDVDLLNIESFADRVISLMDYRRNLHAYLTSKMNIVAPNLAALIGEIVGARLISHAGSLTNLSKYPASTVQILGAEKALFRALKTKGNTPKYGLIYHSSFIGKAAQKNKGRISRFLANKCSIASRIDCFTEAATGNFGEAMKLQVEERLKFYESGEVPRKNADVMSAAAEEAAKIAAAAPAPGAPAAAAATVDDDAMDVDVEEPKKKAKESKKSSKSKDAKKESKKSKKSKKE